MRFNPIYFRCQHKGYADTSGLITAEEIKRAAETGPCPVCRGLSGHSMDIMCCDNRVAVLTVYFPLIHAGTELIEAGIATLLESRNLEIKRVAQRMRVAMDVFRVNQVAGGGFSTGDAPIARTIKWEFEDNLRDIPCENYHRMFLVSRVVEGVRMFPYSEDKNGKREYLIDEPFGG